MEYFVGHQLTHQYIKDLRAIISNVFEPHGFKPYYPDENIEGQSLLVRICQKIFLSHFSIFDLSTARFNVYLEMGIALALNRYVLVIAQRGSHIPKILEGYPVLIYDNYSNLEEQLEKLRQQGFPPDERNHNWKDFCYFCNKICAGVTSSEDDNTYLLLEDRPLLWRDLKAALKKQLDKRHLYPISLKEKASSELPALSELRRKVLSSQFVICHLGMSDETGFLGLGMAIGSRKPWLLLAEKEKTTIPSNVQGFDRLEYQALADFEGLYLSGVLNRFLDMIMFNSAINRDANTKVIERPFWEQFDIWINRILYDTDTSETIRDQTRIIQVDGQRYINKYYVPPTGLLVGRGKDCDIQLDNEYISATHFRIIKGAGTNYFIQDLSSKNGTFLNGNKLPAKKRTKLNFKDVISITRRVKFVVWDMNPFDMEEASARRLHDTDGLVPKIHLSDVPIPSHIDSIEQPIILVAVRPDSSGFIQFETQIYYPMGQILSALVKIIGLQSKEYCFKVGSLVIDDNETPLSLGLKDNFVLQIVSKKLSEETR
jgi:hypothetical protein